MKRDDTVYLRHILDAISLIQEYTKGMSEHGFISNSMAHDAVVRQIEIISEAARNVSDEFQEQHSDLPWDKMTGIRKKSFTNTSTLTIRSCGTQYKMICRF